MNTIIVFPTHITIPDYDIGVCSKLEFILSRYDKVYHQYVAMGMWYDSEKRELYIPRGLDVDYVARLVGREVIYSDYFDDYGTLSLRMTKFPRSELQNDLIKFLIGLDSFSYNSALPQLIGNAETGEGKTFCAIAALVYLRMKTIIIVNRKNIIKNWIDSLDEYTDIDRKRILELTTANIKKLIHRPSLIKKYHIFVATHRTLQSNANTHGWNFITDLFKSLGIGLKIYDEAHMEFSAMTMTDFYTNTKKTFYLTANMERSAYDENSIFQKCFKTVPRFDQIKRGYTDSKKHIVMLVAKYNSKPSVRDIADCRNIQGFNKHNYSEYQVTRDREFYIHLDALVSNFTVDKKFRTLILVSKISSCEAIAEYYRSLYPDLSIGVYNSAIDKKEKQRVLDEDRLIISTSSSLGFSETISELRCVINCEAFRSKITGNQASGRLRRLGDDITCYYIEMIDEGFSSIRAQFKEREARYKTQFSKIVYLK